ncbi:hypothetical protein KIN20_021099 [Parelaphostrongylus tenuis]|uniref:Uncharacterized protein n=1 Tax=Parelaphostrongylus tenuis TaxID=148309 RepID=A0AAD5QU89_PARTN|nr:hypothetical protein KIN20_021099 [Parelaphostrongylus tenuis]
MDASASDVSKPNDDTSFASLYKEEHNAHCLSGESGYRSTRDLSTAQAQFT